MRVYERRYRSNRQYLGGVKVTEKEERRLIKGAFKYYIQYKDIVDERGESIASPSTTAYSAVQAGKSSAFTIHGFTEMLTNVLSTKWYLWYDVVDKTIKYFAGAGLDNYIKLIDYKYWRGCREWELKRVLNVEHATLQRWEDQIIRKAREYAVLNYLIQP